MRIKLQTYCDAWQRKRRAGKISTVRHMFPLVALSLSVIGASYLAGGSSYVVLTPTPAYVNAGDSVSIVVEAVAHTPVNAIDIEVLFPKEQLKVTCIDTGGSVITLWTTEPEVEGNKVVLRGGVYRKGFMGKHTIARITAKAINSGDADVIVRNSVFIAGDGSGSEVKIDKSSNKKASIGIGTATKKSSEKTTTTLSGTVNVEVITDIDGDTDVDLTDIQSFMVAWTRGGAIYDFSGDGKMTFRDFAILLSDSFFK